MKLSQDALIMLLLDDLLLDRQMNNSSLESMSSWQHQLNINDQQICNMTNYSLFLIMEVRGKDRYEYAWPELKYEGKSMQVLIRNGKFTINSIVLPWQFIEYLLVVCDKLKLSNAVLHLSLSIVGRFLKVRPNAIPLQLALLTSLSISCKLLQTNPYSLDQFHRWSCNSFTSRDFHRAEKMILSQLNFEIMSDGIGDIQIRMVSHCVKSILDVEYSNTFSIIVEDLEKIVWSYIYGGRLKMREGRDRLLTAAIVHLALIFLTQFSGKFLQTLWACELTNAEEKQVFALSSRLLKEIIGEEKFKHYKI